MCEHPTSSRVFESCAIDKRAQDPGGAQDHNHARDGELDNESIAELIRFFKLLDQWEREARENAEIM